MLVRTPGLGGAQTGLIVDEVQAAACAAVGVLCMCIDGFSASNPGSLAVQHRDSDREPLAAGAPADAQQRRQVDPTGDRQFPAALTIHVVVFAEYFVF